ncbi:MAG TPA: ATP-binding protein [Cyclobacteriaceae bacterium]|nr:ATP-binding protein [Cyclobacteriaceae bacterium]
MKQEWKTLEIDSFKKIKALLTKAQALSSLHVIIGPAGCGKSSSYEWYKRNHANVFLVKIEHTYSPKDFYIEILRKLGVNDHDRTANLKTMSDRIAYLLRERKEKCLLLLDECSKASSRFLQNFQCVRDLTVDNLGIIMSGTEKFKKDFESWVSKNHIGIPELNSRIYSWEEIDFPSYHEKHQIIEANGINTASVIKKIAMESKDLRKVYQAVIELRYEAESKDNKKT